MKLQFKKNHFINILFYVLFGLLIFSIPVFSYRAGLYIITWALTILLIALVAIDCIFIKKKIEFNFVIFCLLFFCFAAIVSSALNRFKGFSLTPILLCFLSIAIYEFIIQNNISLKSILSVSLCGLLLFLLVYLFIYFKEIVKFDFSKRLGGELGDENDIAISNALGFIVSLYFILYSRKVLYKIANIIPLFLFGLCGLTSGSKIFILLVFVVSIILIGYKNGRKRLWLTLLMIGLIVLSIILVFSIPQFAVIKERILSFFYTLTGISVGKNSSTDLSTIYRVNMITNGFQMFLRKPLFGFGINGFSVYGGMNEGWSHNHFSETFCDFGIIGTSIFHIPLLFSTWCLHKQTKNKIEIILLVSFFVTCMFSIALFSSKLFSLLSPFIYSACPSFMTFSLKIKKGEKK